ncbi:MAG: DUF998 domain-containing protein [Chloroflexi bacterium]|nr:MAG: DUF998 domain-containing protein [Chloroflexota bacterium]
MAHGERAQRRLRSAVVARPLAVLAFLAAGAATVIVVVAQVVSPGYDSLTRTVSRLAAPGMPAAGAVDVAIALVAVACFALAIAHSRARGALAVAGVGFALASVIHLDPASAVATTAHRAASGLAVAGLVISALATQSRVSVGLGALEVTTLAAGLVLLTTPFAFWGAWERWLLAVALAWMAWLAVTIVSRQESASAASASTSSAAATTPVNSVTSANR